MALTHAHEAGTFILQSTSSSVCFTIRFWFRNWLFAVCAVVGFSEISAFADETQFRSSSWDAQLLLSKHQDVSINASNMTSAWEELGRKYLLRFNLYMDVVSDADSVPFSFTKKSATGMELLKAFLGAYPAYTYTESPETGVIWIHRKSVPPEDILPEIVSVGKAASQVPMYSGVFQPLCQLLASRYPISGFIPHRDFTYDYSIDFPVGEFSFKRIVENCCVENPRVAFEFSPLFHRDGGMIIQGNVIELDYKNPLAPPRALAVSYWETEIGKTSNGVPSYEEIAAALVNPNPGIRTRASRYLELTPLNYKRANLCKTNSSDELRKAEWIAVGLKSITFSADSHFPMLSNEQIAWLMSPFTNNLAQIDPDLALLFSMALAPEKNDPSLMDCVAGHKFTEAEIAVIKPDVYRIARQSKLVRDKLIKMKFDAPELSPEVLHELENTNLFKLVP